MDTQPEVINELIELRNKVTELGFKKVKQNTPIPLQDMIDKWEPFIIIEKAFDKAIKHLSAGQAGSKNQ